MSQLSSDGMSSLGELVSLPGLPSVGGTGGFVSIRSVMLSGCVPSTSRVINAPPQARQMVQEPLYSFSHLGQYFIGNPV